MGSERRNIKNRAQVVQRVIDGIVQNPSVTLTVNTLQQWLGVPLDAAQRILERLASSGLVREVQKGVWARGTWPGAQRDWYYEIPNPKLQIPNPNGGSSPYNEWV
jgi:hypothetical protein